MNEYPKVVGVCPECGKDVIAKNRWFDKPNRKFCSIRCRNTTNNRKRVWTEEAKQKLAENARKRMTGSKRSLASVTKSAAGISGANHWNWKGGITDDQHRERNNIKAKYWSRIVRERDNYTCQECGCTTGLIDAHRIEPFMDNPDRRFDVTNGVTLCRSCHAKADGRIRSKRRTETT